MLIRAEKRTVPNSAGIGDGSFFFFSFSFYFIFSTKSVMDISIPVCYHLKEIIFYKYSDNLLFYLLSKDNKS